MTGSDPDGPQLTITSETEVVVRRAFPAPQELVFEALTRCRQLRRWCGERGSMLTACEVDARPGGAFRLAERTRTGAARALAGTYREVTAPSRLDCSCAFEVGGRGRLEARASLTLSERDGVTLLTATTGFTSREDRDAYLASGLGRAAAEAYDRIAEMLAVDTTPAAEGELVVARLLDARPEQVFAAWTETDRLARWWGPPGFEMVEQRLDLRPGGLHLYGMRPPGGRVTWGKSVYREILPPERLVYLSAAADEDGATVRNASAPEWPLEVLNTLTLFDMHGRTMLILRGRPEGAVAAERAAFAAGTGHVSRGFDATFARLQAHLAGGEGDGDDGDDGDDADGDDGRDDGPRGDGRDDGTGGDGTGVARARGDGSGDDGSGADPG